MNVIERTKFEVVPSNVPQLQRIVPGGKHPTAARGVHEKAQDEDDLLQGHNRYALCLDAHGKTVNFRRDRENPPMPAHRVLPASRSVHAYRRLRHRARRVPFQGVQGIVGYVPQRVSQMVTYPMSSSVCRNFFFRVVFTDVLQNSIRDISEIEPEWLYELAPHYYDFGSETVTGPKLALF